MKAAFEDVNTANSHKNSTGYIYSTAVRGKVHQGKNGAYQWNTNNCFDRTYASLSKGTLANGMNAGTYMKELGFKGGLIPNNAIAKFSEVFMNDSFTYSGAYGGLYNYAYYYSINSEWAQKWQKANYANSVIGW